MIFVGRITRQKGLPLFLRAAAQLPPDVQLVLCAGAPDTPEIEAEVRGLVESLAATRSGVVWIAEMLPRADVVALLTAATVFACPSIYEPLGIVNLEAMACETAVVATATGGIPEVVVHGETGWLVPIEQATDGTGTPLHPEQYVADLAAALNDAVSDPDRARTRGAAGRVRAQESFSWDAIAARTVEFYRSLTGRRRADTSPIPDASATAGANAGLDFCPRVYVPVEDASAVCPQLSDADSMDVVTALERSGGLSTRAALIAATSRADVDRALREGAVVRVAHGRYALPRVEKAESVAHSVNGHLGPDQRGPPPWLGGQGRAGRSLT